MDNRNNGSTAVAQSGSGARGIGGVPTGSDRKNDGSSKIAGKKNRSRSASKNHKKAASCPRVGRSVNNKPEAGDGQAPADVASGSAAAAPSKKSPIKAKPTADTAKSRTRRPMKVKRANKAIKRAGLAGKKRAPRRR